MRAKVVPVLTVMATAGLLIWAGAQAATTEGHFGGPVSAAISTPGSIQLAGSGSGNKLGDKYLSGRAGGRYGIGGTEHGKATGSKSKAKDGKSKAGDGNKGNGASSSAKPAS
jgi:hypothetical protein